MSSVEPSWDDDAVPLRAAPALAWLAVLAAGFDAIGTRLLVRLANDRELFDVSHALLLELKRGGDMSRNLAGIAGLVALSFALLDFLQPRPYVPLYQRIGLAGFAGVFLPTIALATILSAERTTLLVVLVAAGAANMLVLALSLSSMRWRAPWALRIGLAAIGASAFFAFTALITLLVGKLTLWEAGYPLGQFIRHVGECCFLGGVVALAFDAWPAGSSGPRRWLAFGLGVLASAIVAVAYALPPSLLPDDPSELLYGAAHVALFVDSFPWIYAATFGLAAGLASMGLLTPGPIRQGAVGTLLLLFGGYSPSTPVTLLMMVLGVTLLSRSVIAKSTLRWLKESSAELDELSREMDTELDELERA